MFQRLVQGDAQHIGHQLGDPVRIRIGHIQRPAYIPNGCLSRHGAESDDLGHMVRPVFLHHIVDDLLPPLDAKIDVEIRHGHPLRIQKPLENQVVFDGVDVRDVHGVGRQAAGPAAPARAYEDPLAVGEIHEVPHDEEVVHKPHLDDHIHLVLQPLPHRLGGAGHFPLQALPAQLAQIVVVVHPVRRGEPGQMPLAKLDLHMAFFCDLFGIGQGLGIGVEHLGHLLLALEVKLLRLHPHPVFIGHHPVGLDAQEHILGFRILPVHVMHIVGGHGLNGQFLGQSGQLGQDPLLLRQAVILQLNVEIRPEDPLQPGRQRLCILVPALEQQLGDVPRQAGG